MVKGRSCENQAVQQRHRDADRQPLLQVLQHPPANRAVDVEPIVDARLSRRDYVRLAVDTESDVTDKGFVDDGVDRFALVAAAITLAGYGRSGGFGGGIQGCLRESTTEDVVTSETAKGPVCETFGSRQRRQIQPPIRTVVS